MVDKKMLSVEEIESQAVLELPDREMMALVNVVITNFLNNNDIDVNIPVNAAVNLCAAVLAVDSDVTCTIDGVEQNN